MSTLVVQEFEQEGNRPLGKGGRLSTQSTSSWQPLTAFRRFLVSAFLPEGYPQSVSGDYLEYQLWDSLQAMCSSVTGLLSTRAVLEGVGVGEASATPAAAVTQWIIRDGTGMIGRIVFAWFQGTNLDCNAKSWRLFADILNDIGMFLELISPLFPQAFLFLLCTGSLAKAIVGVAGAATRAAITQHQAIRNNMADVSAKDGSQETAVSLVGLFLGLAVTPLMNSQTAIWILFVVFTFLHLFFNYLAVSSVVFSTFNRERASLAIADYLTGLVSPTASSSVPSPKQIAAIETVLPIPSRSHLILGGRLSDLNISEAQFEQLAKIFENEKYLLSVKESGDVVVLLRKSAEQKDILKSFFHAEAARLATERKIPSILSVSLEDASYDGVQRLFSSFVEEAQRAGWVVDHHHLAPQHWRVEWTFK